MKTPGPQNFSAKLYNLLSRLEMILLGLLMLAVVLKQMDMTAGDTVLRIALSGLAGLFFLMAFRRPDIVPPEGQKLNAFDLAYYTMLPKLAWLSCAVMTIGILFTFLHLPGNKDMLTIGAPVGALALIILGLGFMRSSERPNSYVNMLYRLLPLTALSAYLISI